MNRVTLWSLCFLMFTVVASAGNGLTAKCGKFTGFEIELNPEADKKFVDNETVFSFAYPGVTGEELMFSTNATLHGAEPEWHRLKALYHSEEKIVAVDVYHHGHSVYTLLPKDNVAYITTLVHLKGDSPKGRGSILKAECSFGGKSDT